MKNVVVFSMILISVARSEKCPVIDCSDSQGLLEENAACYLVTPTDSGKISTITIGECPASVTIHNYPQYRTSVGSLVKILRGLARIANSMKILKLFTTLSSTKRSAWRPASLRVMSFNRDCKEEGIVQIQLTVLREVAILILAFVSEPLWEAHAAIITNVKQILLVL